MSPEDEADVAAWLSEACGEEGQGAQGVASGSGAPWGEAATAEVPPLTPTSRAVTGGVWVPGGGDARG